MRSASLIAILASALMIAIALGDIRESRESDPQVRPGPDSEVRSSRMAGLPKHLGKDELHREAIQEGLAPDKDEYTKRIEKEIIMKLNSVIDAFVNSDLESLSKHVHPRMVELDTDLPEPDSPTIPSVLPRSRVKERPSVALTMPSEVGKWTRRSSTWRKGPSEVWASATGCPY